MNDTATEVATPVAAQDPMVSTYPVSDPVHADLLARTVQDRNRALSVIEERSAVTIRNLLKAMSAEVPANFGWGVREGAEGLELMIQDRTQKT